MALVASPRTGPNVARTAGEPIDLDRVIPQAGVKPSVLGDKYIVAEQVR